MNKKIEEYLERIEERLNIIEERAIHIEDKQDRIRNGLIKLFSGKCVAEIYGEDEIEFDFGIFGMWHTKNYGAALTSYAIYKLVFDEGYSCVQLYLPIIGNDKVSNDDDNISSVFIKKYCKVTERTNIDHAVVFNKKCKAFLVPSDSLFGGGYNYQLDVLQGVLLGAATKNNRPIMSFSTSFGGWNPDKGLVLEEEIYKKLLSEFSHLSFRERTGQKLAKDNFNIEANHTLDPVFLLDSAEYEKLIEEDKTTNDSDYIFAYIMSPSNEKMLFLKKYSEELNCKVYCILNMNKERITNFETSLYKEIYFEENSTVEHWLRRIKQAKFVVTDSYHGLCFSIIFQKRFGILKPHNAVDRFTDLLDYLGLCNCKIINNTEDINNNVTAYIDYKKINEILKEKVEKDMEELRFALRQCINKKILKTSDMTYEELREQLILRKVLDILS